MSDPAFYYRSSAAYPTQPAAPPQPYGVWQEQPQQPSQPPPLPSYAAPPQPYGVWQEQPQQPSQPPPLPSYAAPPQPYGVWQEQPQQPSQPQQPPLQNSKPNTDRPISGTLQCWLVILILLIAGGIGAALYFLKIIGPHSNSSGNNNNNNDTSPTIVSWPSARAPNITLRALPAAPPTLNQPPWNTATISHGERISNIIINDTTITAQDNTSSTATSVMQMTYVVNTYGRKSGGAMFSNPFKLFPAEAATLQYEVYFSDDFDFVIAGKLPGVTLGEHRGQHASGGNWDPEGKFGSFRVMWQKGTPESAIIKGYLYEAVPGGPQAAFNAQGPHFQSVGDADDLAGNSVYYHRNPSFVAHRGQWNTISFTVRLNTVGVADGYLKMVVNGVEREIDDVVWRTANTTLLYEVYWVSIFGGSGPEYAPTNPNAHSLFRNIEVGTAYRH